GSQINQIPTKYSQAESTKFLVLTVVSILCIVGVLLASTVVYCLRHRSHHKLKEKLTNLGTDATSDATATYQELCRQRMAVKPPTERQEPISSRINSVSSQFSDGGPAVSPSARSSISSWSEEPAHSNMDISTGHMILSYMEDHLKNKDRLEKEWEALCAYQAEPNACTAGMKDGNAKKNRSTAVVAYDHSRITLKVENSQGNSDYINASPIAAENESVTVLLCAENKVGDGGGGDGLNFQPMTPVFPFLLSPLTPPQHRKNICGFVHPSIVRIVNTLCFFSVNLLARLA
ncbi:Receptor-type tyrosine-protein phosphatase N2, partial [Larimichthys crocea]